MRLQSSEDAGNGASAAGLRELASGIDALYMSGHGSASPGLMTELEAHRLVAEEHREPVPIQLGDGRWSLEPRGLGRYRFCRCLECAEIFRCQLFAAQYEML